MTGLDSVRVTLAVAGVILVLGGCKSGPPAAPPRSSPAEEIVEIEAPQHREHVVEIDVLTDATAPLRPLGKWSFSAFGGGAAPVAGTKLEVELTSDGHVRGHAGCNRFFGDFSVEQAHQIAMGPFGSTRMACPPPVMEQESRFLDALGKAESFRVVGEKLELSDAAGKILLVFSRT